MPHRSVAVVLGVALLATLTLAGCVGGDDESATGSTSSTTATSTSTTRRSRAIASSTSSSTAPTVPVPVEVALPRSIVWIHLFDDTLKTPEGVEQVLDEVESAGIDAVFAQVVRRHDAYFDSRYLPPTPDPGLTPGFDVLDALITGAHSRGIQLHAWFVVAPAYHHQYDELVMPEGHVWLEHGPDSADSWMTVGYSGTVSTDYLDVGLPAVQDHVVAIIEDIARRYEVDGIHLDYVRYDGRAWGYHPGVLDLFAAETGRSDHPSTSDSQWVQWRQDRNAHLMERARATLRDARPGALLSAAVIAGGEGPSGFPRGFAGTRAAVEYLQDWPSWLDEEVVDFVVAMAYIRQAIPEHAAWFRDWVSFAGELSQRHPGRVGVGVGAYLNPVSSALAQIELVQSTVGFVGVYSYQQDSSETPRGQVLARCCGSG